MPHGEQGNVIACFTIYGCLNGVRVVLDLERSGWQKIKGSERLEYVALDMGDLESTIERILGNERVATQLEKCLTTHGLMAK